MKKYTSISDITSLSKLVDEAIQLKKNPYAFENLGKRKTLVMLFFNPSLRTRLSTQKAAQQLGMEIMVMNISSDGWVLEFEDGSTMDSVAAEHIKEAAQVVSQYADIIAIRAFAGLKNKEEDYSEKVLNSFVKYTTVPIVSLESATGHPLQALADAITIKEHQKKNKPKVVLTWAPHPKALPQAVANSFVQMMQLQNADFIITHPKGYELDKEIIKNSKVEYNQDKAFENADFIYAKNWSSVNEYGKILLRDKNWMITEQKMKLTNNAKFMHCLPVRRNVVVDDAVLDSENSLVIEQANNRTFSAQIVLKKMLENG
ncbi:N-acetylornithine carbamoyltransferase [Aureibaculum conchae]|uniref:N-acetylornithine carbamoyltransferase n=1 Tax=Aureibaculum sp. 2308TA14-22 TaxID=3108392 RepID=UPI0033934C41